MQAVITKEQAKQITRGRTPLVPVEYETAISALQACVTLDEAKYWNDKSDALAAWAKIYHSPDAQRRAKQLKLHAFRRMGELAQELRPQQRATVSGAGSRFTDGPRTVLKAQGLSDQAAASALYIARLPEREFSKEIARERPRAPETYRRSFFTSSEWAPLRQSAWGLRSQIRQLTPKQASDVLEDSELVPARELAKEISEWLDEFEQRISKRLSK